MSRKLSDLQPEVQQMTHRLIGAAATLGVEVFIVHTLRTFEEQDELYSRGRLDSNGIPRAGPRVTNAIGGRSWHNHGCAVDLAWENTGGAPIWSVPPAQWELLGIMGERIGFEWGGRENVGTAGDYGHFQHRPGEMTISEALDMWPEGWIP